MLFSTYYWSLIQHKKKNNQVWARLTDDRVARDDRCRHIEFGVYLTNHSRDRKCDLKALSSEKIMIIALITLM